MSKKLFDPTKAPINLAAPDNDFQEKPKGRKPGKTGPQKRPTERRARQTNKVMPFYTVREIMQFIGYNTVHGTRYFLFKLNVPMHFLGKKYIIYLSDLQTHAPELFASILEANNLNRLVQEHEPAVQDEDEYMTNQFRS